jgi:hypothetical protein
MNKDFLKLAEQLNKTEKLTSLAVIEQVKKLTKLTEETRSEFESVISAYNILKKYYEGMPLEKEISKISDTIESNLNNVHEKAEATDKEIKSIVSSVDKLFKEIARVEKMKPKELTQTIIERIQEIPLELSKEKKDELIAETQTEENISKVVEGINNLPITPEQQIDAKHIKNLPDIDGRIRSIGISNKYLAQLLDVDLSGLDYVGGKYVLGSGTGGGGGEMFIDQTPDNGTYDLLGGDVDGVNTTFTVSQGEYPTGKLVVALNGQILEQGATEDFVETTPASGIFDFVVAPQVGDVVTAFYSTGTGGGGGATAFTDLTDVPSSYTSQALKVVRVNAGETALEFTTLAGGGDALTTDPLSQFASTTSSQLAGVISDETGSGALVFANSPTLVTPTLGAATATSLNTHTIPGGTGTIALTSDLHSAVTVTDSSEIDFTLTGQDITASLITGSIDETKLDASVNASLDLADSASQPGHTHTLANITDVTASVAEVNVLDGVTSTTAELNILDGVTATASEINVLDGITATVTELNYTDGVTSAIQTQLNGKAVLSQTTSNTWNFQGTTADGDYILTLKAGFAMTITETTTKCTSGTATATFKINTTALGGTANSVSSSEQSQSHASSNSVSAGDDIVVTISSASSLTNMVISILATRTLA